MEDNEGQSEDRGVVVPRQDEIRVFENSCGDISISQVEQNGSEHIVVVAPLHAQAVADALVRVAREIQEREE